MGDHFRGRGRRGGSRGRFDGSGRGQVSFGGQRIITRRSTKPSETKSHTPLLPGSIIIKTRPDRLEPEEPLAPSPPLPMPVPGLTSHSTGDLTPPTADVTSSGGTPPSIQTSYEKVKSSEIYVVRGRGRRLGSWSTASQFHPLRNPKADAEKRGQRTVNGSGSGSPTKSLTVPGLRGAGFSGGRGSHLTGTPPGGRNRAQQQGDARPTKLINSSLHWDERAGESLVEQSDFLVAGVLGSQGVGKSTVMSLLAGSRSPRSTRFFRIQSDEVKSLHETAGVDMLVTTERIILLDTQPMMSPSILHDLYRSDRWLPSDVPPENQHHIESLQLATFLMSVCDVVIVVLDHLDVSLFRLIRTAQTLTSVSDGFMPQMVRQSKSQSGDKEFAPHVLFLHNSAGRELFCPTGLSYLHKYIYNQMAEVEKKEGENEGEEGSKEKENGHQKLKWCSGISLLSTSALTFSKEDLAGQLPSKEIDCNLFLLPFTDLDSEDRSLDSASLSLLPGFVGHPSFQLLAETFRNNVFCLPRQAFQPNSSITESHWFHNAGRCWAAIKKSSLFSEYAQHLNQ
eukprot:m.31118 g.31118  ORF g.31118 m.31118 type:complete len:565 (+) comp31451_c0_seq1:15-1709(+)